MPPRLARKPVNTYHHGDLRDALVQAALVEAEQAGPEAISIKALAKKPTDRYRSAKELAQEIERWLADEPVAAYPEPWTVKTRRWTSRLR